jgi:prepilin-type N-terminal cleavage/methylation domain-containing protein
MRITSGFTLVELMVVLTILGVLAGVSVSSLPSLRESTTTSMADRLAAAHRDAITTASTVLFAAPFRSIGGARTWRFLPDGRALGPGLDPRNSRMLDTLLAAERAP